MAPNSDASSSRGLQGDAMLFTCRECAPGNGCGPLLACILNMTAAFGVLICLWTVTPKHICRMDINPIVAFCAFCAAGGIGAGAILTEVQTETVSGASEVGCHEDEPCPVAISSTTPLGTRAQIEDACLQRAAVIQRRYGLTEREAQIAALLLEGRSRPYIRDELVISLNTVHTHARSIYAKCGVHSQREFMELPDEK